MESVRRYISHLYAKATEQSGAVVNTDGGAEELSKPLQMVIVFSLQSSGMANLELELLPFLLDLLKNHFPGMVGAVYIVHYGWVHSGMWGLAKRLLPQQALAKIFFPSKKELPEHFDLDKFPIALGGEWDIPLDDDTNNVMKRFARPNLHGVLYSAKGGRGAAEEPDWERSSAPPSPKGISGAVSPGAGWTSRGVSRSNSFDSLAEHFYSYQNTPRHLTPRTSQTPTPHNELTHFAFPTTGNSSPVSPMLQMTPTAARKLQQVKQSRERAARKRSDSDVNGRTSTEDIAVHAQSPVMSRGSSPNRSRRRTLTAVGSRNVHFQSAEPGGILGERGAEGLKRIGSLRDFRLQKGDFDDTNLDRGDSSGSEQSDKSGKVGESTTSVRQVEKPAGGFFSRWRTTSNGKAARQEVKVKEEEDDLEELESTPMSSPELQVTGIDEPRLSGFDSRAGSRNILSRRSRKFGALPGHVSPYNASNPFYGYPAYPMTNGDEPARRSSLQGPYQLGQEQRRLQFRRRKRDLLRTLMYLFVLRLLSTHRRVRNQLLAAYRGLVRAARVGGVAEDEEESKEWKEANNRYNRLRSASLRYGDEDNRLGRTEHSQPQQAQPLIQLGFRKRYAFLLLFLFIMVKRDWRTKMHLRMRDVLGYAGIGKVGLETVTRREGVDQVEDQPLEVEVVDLTPASITGLHLRRRLGWQ